MSQSPAQVEDEENKALLQEEDGHVDWRQPDITILKASRTTSWRQVARKSVLVLVVLATGLLIRAIWFQHSNDSHPNLTFHGSEMRSNGTHDFKRTVLMVSIDGLRADYLDRGLTPHLLAISKKGLRAKSMQPIFPTLTFPNHWALMTGLYAESHGIVANNFWDPTSQTEFHYNRVESCWNASWWYGEPVWETAEKAGIRSANLMWQVLLERLASPLFNAIILVRPGPPKTIRDISSTYFVPWKASETDKVPLDNKLDQILRWLDLPLVERPQLILAYEPSLDQAGHKAGPGSALVNATLREVDLFAKNLHDNLEVRNLTDIVDVVFVSDHGMTDTSHPELVYVDDILGKEGMAAIEHEDGWPAMGFWFNSQSNIPKYLDLLLNASTKNPEKFAVYTHDSMPQKYHFANNERIAPIYVIPSIGYALTTHAEGADGMSKGNHGYDNHELSMHAMFIAHGPFSKVVKDLHQERKRLVTRAKGWHSTAEDTYIMDRFQNVEIYNLIVKLLGISETAANTNGTRGFWDTYL
ncbi:Phosphodiest domain containing protein [Amanita muscaria]